MESSTYGEAVNPPCYCGSCGEAIDGEASLSDGELVCRPCWAAQAADDARERLEELTADQAAAMEEVRERQDQFDEELGDLNREYDADMAELRAALRARTRAVTTARERLARYEAMTTPEVPPIAGGGPDFVPTDEDLADYAEWSARLDALDLERRMEDEADPRYGYE